MFILFICSTSYASESAINVLTWWGYLDSPWISKMVSDDCHVKLSYDSYATNTEMFKIIKNHPHRYAVVILSYTDYNKIKNYISLNNSQLYKVSNDYNPIIRNKYLSLGLPHNVALFMLSLTGFIWNPAVISLNNNDSVKTIFKKSESNIVTLIDDPTEINMLLALIKNQKYNNTDYIFSFNTLKKLVGNANVVISNNAEQAYSLRNFAMGYQWSGIALSEMKSYPTYHFLINKHLTYVSADMVVQLNDSQSAICVSNLFASKKFLQKLQLEAYYFSPYADDRNVPPGKFKDMYSMFIQQLPYLQWIKPLSNAQLNLITQRWAMIKYYINSRNK